MLTYGQMKAIMTNLAALPVPPADSVLVKFKNPPQVTLHDGDLVNIKPVFLADGAEIEVGAGSSSTVGPDQIVLEADLT
jgi:hypothetical protein